MLIEHTMVVNKCHIVSSTDRLLLHEGETKFELHIYLSMRELSPTERSSSTSVMTIDGKSAIRE